MVYSVALKNPQKQSNCTSGGKSGMPKNLCTVGESLPETGKKIQHKYEDQRDESGPSFDPSAPH